MTFERAELKVLLSSSKPSLEKTYVKHLKSWTSKGKSNFFPSSFSILPSSSLCLSPPVRGYGGVFLALPPSALWVSHRKAVFTPIRRWYAYAWEHHCDLQHLSRTLDRVQQLLHASVLDIQRLGWEWKSPTWSMNVYMTSSCSDGN